MNLDNGTLPDPLAIVALPDKKIAEKHWKSWYKPSISRIIPPILPTHTSFTYQMSVPVPPILPTHTPSSYKISPAFPVRFPAFPHKTNNTLSCPQRKKDKNSKGTLYCPVHSLSVYTKEPIYCPQIRFPHINDATKG